MTQTESLPIEMTRRTAIHEALEQFAKQGGFERVAGAWYRQGDDVVTVLDLQKSQYGPSYYLNVGFWLRELGGERLPKPESAHITIRLETLAPEKRLEVARLLDMTLR